MKAIVRKDFGGPEQLQICEVPDPVAAPGEVRVRVKAFGINRAEQYSDSVCGARWPQYPASNALAR